MRKMGLRRCKLGVNCMDASVFVDHASDMLSRMIKDEVRGPGDVDGAMRRISETYRIPYAYIWSDRYRKPKEIAAHVYAAIVEAYDNHSDMQDRKRADERARTEAKSGLAAYLVRAADFVAGENH